ncbi:MAG: TIGR00295 family protein [archaeon]|nr:TIGR00295 family protein [archaeon]
MDELNILKKENCPEFVIKHSIAVYKKAMEISTNFNEVNLDLVRQGALLHDVGRSVTHGIEHAVEGAKIAKRYGYPIEVQNIIERHIGAGISLEESKELPIPTKSYIPQTLEEKIVVHSDNLLHGDKPVDIDFVAKKWEKRMENPKENIERLKKLNKELIEDFEE